VRVIQSRGWHVTFSESLSVLDVRGSPHRPLCGAWSTRHSGLILCGIGGSYHHCGTYLIRVDMRYLPGSLQRWYHHTTTVRRHSNEQTRFDSMKHTWIHAVRCNRNSATRTGCTRLGSASLAKSNVSTTLLGALTTTATCTRGRLRTHAATIILGSFGVQTISGCRLSPGRDSYVRAEDTFVVCVPLARVR
jgi:hypothetical protein